MSGETGGRDGWGRWGRDVCQSYTTQMDRPSHVRHTAQHALPLNPRSPPLMVAFVTATLTHMHTDSHPVIPAMGVALMDLHLCAK